MIYEGDAAHFEKISVLSQKKEVPKEMNVMFWFKKNYGGYVTDMRDCVKGIVLEGILPVGTYMYHISPSLKRGFPDGDIAFYSLSKKDLRQYFSPYLTQRYPGRKQLIHRYKVTKALRVLIFHPGFTCFDWAEAQMYMSDLDEDANEIDYRDDIFREIGRRGEYDAIFTIQNLEDDIMNELILFDRVKGNKVVWSPPVKKAAGAAAAATVIRA